MKTLILFAHTFWENSKVNKALLQSVQGAPNLTIENLTLSCPNGAIDVEAQKALLKNADSIIFQFPLFWFSTPSLLKEWQDRVLTGILYGSEPKLLEGKNFGIITTAGGAESPRTDRGIRTVPRSGTLRDGRRSGRPWPYPEISVTDGTSPYRA